MEFWRGTTHNDPLELARHARAGRVLGQSCSARKLITNCPVTSPEDMRCREVLPPLDRAQCEDPAEQLARPEVERP
jgi:hypothetical protein